MKILLPCFLMFIFITGCKEEKEIMSGEITGIVSLYSQENIKMSDCSGVKVGLYQDDSHIGDTVTDSYGEFHFKDLPYGKYCVDLERDNYIKEDVSTCFDHLGGGKTTVANFKMYEIPDYQITIYSFESRGTGYFNVYLKVNNDTIIPIVNDPLPFAYNLKAVSGSTPDFSLDNSLGYALGYLTDRQPYLGTVKTAVYGDLYDARGYLQPPGYDSVYLKIYPCAFGQGVNFEVSDKALGKPSNVIVFHW